MMMMILLGRLPKVDLIICNCHTMSFLPRDAAVGHISFRSLWSTQLVFFLHPSLYFLLSWAWWDWPLTWLTNHRPSVLWHCWLGHLTRTIVSEMTYNVSSGTLNPTIRWHVLLRFIGNSIYGFIFGPLCRKRCVLRLSENVAYTTSDSFVIFGVI